MKKAALLVALAAAVVVPPAASAGGISIQFKNSSKWSIVHIYISPAKENEWGPDQLGDADTDVIEPGATFTLTNVAPGKHDMKIVDEDGDECIVASEKLGNDTLYDISDADLVGCQQKTAEAVEEAEGEEDAE